MTEEELYEQYLYEQYLKETAGRNPDLPGAGDLVGTPLEQPEGREAPERSPTETFAGALEAVGTMISSPLSMVGATVGAADGFVGSLAQAYASGDGTYADNLKNVVSGPNAIGTENFNRNMAGRQQELIADSMYQPRTEVGQENVQAIGEAIAPLEALEPLIPSIAGMIPNAVNMGRAGTADAGIYRNLDGPTKVEAEQAKRAEAARTGGASLPSGERLSVGAAATREGTPGIETDAAAIEANRYVTPETVEMYRDATPETREVMSETMRRASNGKPAAKPEDLPRAAVGNVVAERALQLARTRQRYGDQIKSTVEAMKGELINTTQMGQAFDDILSKYNIRRNEDGSFDLSGSRIADAEANRTLKEVFSRMDRKIANGEAEFEGLHTDKQWLQDMADYDKPGQGGSGQLNNAIKEMAGAVNNALRVDADGNVNAYGRANDAFSQTVEPFTELAKLSGDKFARFDDPKTSAEIARKSRGLTNNTKQGVDLAAAMDQIEALLSKAAQDGTFTPEEMAALGFDPKTGKFKGDIHEMSHFLSTVESLHPQQRPNSLGSIMDQNAQAVGDAVADAGLGAVTGGKWQVIKGLKDAIGGGRPSRNAAEQAAREKITNSLLDIVER